MNGWEYETDTRNESKLRYWKCVWGRKVHQLITIIWTDVSIRTDGREERKNPKLWNINEWKMAKYFILRLTSCRQIGYTDGVTKEMSHLIQRKISQATNTARLVLKFLTNRKVFIIQMCVFVSRTEWYNFFLNRTSWRRDYIVVIWVTRTSRERGRTIARERQRLIYIFIPFGCLVKSCKRKIDWWKVRTTATGNENYAFAIIFGLNIQFTGFCSLQVSTACNSAHFCIYSESEPVLCKINRELKKKNSLKKCMWNQTNA